MTHVCAGRVFFVSGHPFPPKAHLWLILSDPNPDTGKVVGVMVVTERPHTDKTVRLGKGDHPFIQHDSNVDYAGALLVHPERLSDAMTDGRCQPHRDMTPELLERTRKGLLASSRTVHAMRDYCESIFGADDDGDEAETNT